MFIKRIIKKSLNKFGYDIVRMDLSLEQEKELIEISKIRKVNYACGTKLLTDWINVDIAPAKNVFKFGKIYYQVDLTKRHPFADNSIEFGFAEDFIEHLSQADAIIFLTEIYRTFKKGGVLRLSFPGLIEMLKKGLSEISYDQAKKMKMYAYTTWNHKHLFSFEELEQVCHHIGFNRMQLVKYGKSEHHELENLDTRIEQIGTNTIVEIVK